MRLPFARAFRIPALTRSTVSERSSSATAPRTVNTILPAGVEVSIESRERKGRRAYDTLSCFAGAVACLAYQS
jgi:hypothetical protein